MPITTQWIVQDRVMLSRLTGKVTLDELEAWLETQTEMVANGTPLVHHIGDSTQLENLEIKLQTFQTMMNAIPQSPNFGWHILVTTNTITKMTSSIVSQFANVRTRNYTTVEQAIEFLKENDQTLRDEIWKNV